jgi:hypothetical protein
MPIAAALVGARGVGGGNTATTAAGTTAASGSTFVAAVSWDASASSPTVTDNKSNTYTAQGTPQVDTRGAYVQLFVCQNGTGGASHTATFTTSGASYPVIHLIEITGAEAASLDKIAQGSDVSTPFTVTSATLSQADEVVISICACNSGTASNAYALSGGTVLSEELDTSNYWTSAAGYTVVSSTAAVTHTWTRATFTEAGIALATFKQASGGGAPAAKDPALNRNRPGRGPYSPGKYFRPLGETAQPAALATQTNLVIADATHGHAADAPVLTAASVLVVADATHAHAADNFTLNTGTQLVAADATHAHPADAPTLTANSQLAVADALHNHAADSPSLALLVPANDPPASNRNRPGRGPYSLGRYFRPLGEMVRLATSTNLVIADATHGHAADAPALTVQSVLAVADATHAHASDALTLTSSTALSINEATHGHAADNVTVDTALTLAVADATHGHSADGLSLTSATALSIADALHGHSADGLVLTTASQLAIAEALHGHAADNVTLLAGQLLLIADGLHAHTSDGLALTVTAWLVVSDATHAHAADNVVWFVPGSDAPQTYYGSGKKPRRTSSEIWRDEAPERRRVAESWDALEQIREAQAKRAAERTAKQVVQPPAVVELPKEPPAPPATVAVSVPAPPPAARPIVAAVQAPAPAPKPEAMAADVEEDDSIAAMLGLQDDAELSAVMLWLAENVQQAQTDDAAPQPAPAEPPAPPRTRKNITLHRDAEGRLTGATIDEVPLGGSV